MAAALVFWDAQEKAKSAAAPGRLKDYSYGDRVVDTLQAFTGGIPSSNDNVGGTYIFGRYLAVAVALYATLRVVTAVYGDHVRAWRASRRSGHTVVAGLSESGVRAVRTCAALDGARGHANPALRSSRRGGGPGASVVWGDPRTAGGLRAAGIEGARRLICSEHTEEGSYETALVALRLRKKNGRGDGPLRIYVASSGGDVAGALTDLGLIPQWVSVESFDLHDLWARRLVEAGPLWRYRYGDEPPPTLVLLGTGRLAQALLLEAARWWHFGTPESQAASELRIHVVAPDAEAVCAAFRKRFPASIRTVGLEPLALDPLQPADVDAIPVVPAGLPWGAYVCVDADDAYRLMVADRYGSRVGDRDDGAIVVAISALGVASRTGARLSLTVPDRPPIVGLGVDDRGGLDVEHLGRTEALARTIHGDYERFMRDKGWTDAPALAPFDSLEERFRESNRRQARDFDAQLTSCLLRTTRLVDWDGVKDFDPAAIEVMSALEHASWVEERLMAGWRLGPERDDDARQRPDIVDWTTLAEARREIDREFIRRRPHVLARIGEQAVPYPSGKGEARPPSPREISDDHRRRARLGRTARRGPRGESRLRRLDTDEAADDRSTHSRRGRGEPASCPAGGRDRAARTSGARPLGGVPRTVGLEVRITTRRVGEGASEPCALVGAARRRTRDRQGADPSDADVPDRRRAGDAADPDRPGSGFIAPNVMKRRHRRTRP